MQEDSLAAIFEELKANNVNLDRMDPSDMEKGVRLCNEKSLIIWINDHSTMQPVFINDKGKEYYGFDSNMLGNKGFELYSDFIHPDHFNDVHRTVTFFEQNPKGTLKMPYIVKNHENEWRWTYSVARAMNFSPAGKAIFVLAIVYDIESLMDGKKTGSNSEFIKENLERYSSLTPREREVLDHIANELTSQEISKILHIEASTVDTHRKHIIKKLGVRNSLGLVKFSFLFSNRNL